MGGGAARRESSNSLFYHDLLPGFFQCDCHTNIQPELLTALYGSTLLQPGFGLGQDLRFQYIRLYSRQSRRGCIARKSGRDPALQVRQLRKKDC